MLDPRKTDGLEGPLALRWFSNIKRWLKGARNWSCSQSSRQGMIGWSQCWVRSKTHAARCLGSQWHLSPSEEPLEPEIDFNHLQSNVASVMLKSVYWYYMISLHTKCHPTWSYRISLQPFKCCNNDSRRSTICSPCSRDYMPSFPSKIGHKHYWTRTLIGQNMSKQDHMGSIICAYGENRGVKRV